MLTLLTRLLVPVDGCEEAQITDLTDFSGVVINGSSIGNECVLKCADKRYFWLWPLIRNAGFIVVFFQSIIVYQRNRLVLDFC